MANIEQQVQQPVLGEGRKVENALNKTPDKVAKNMDFSKMQKSFEDMERAFKESNAKLDRLILERSGKSEQQVPVETQQPVSEIEQVPVETQQPVSEIEQVPVETQQPVSKIEQVPVETQQPVSKIEQVPVETQQPVSEIEQVPVAEQQPVSSEAIDIKKEDQDTIKQITSLNVRAPDFEMKYNELINTIHDKKIIGTLKMQLNKGGYALITDRDGSYYIKKFDENVDDNNNSVQNTTRLGNTEGLSESGFTLEEIKNGAKNTHSDIFDVLEKGGFDENQKIEDLLSIIKDQISFLDTTSHVPSNDELNKRSLEFKNIYTTLTQKDQKIINDILIKNKFF